MNTMLLPLPAGHRNRAWLVASGVFLLALATAASTVWRIEQDRLDLARALASDHAREHADALGAGITNTMSATIALELMIREAKGRVPDLGKVGPELARSYPNAIAFQLAPRGIVASVSPLSGNEMTLGMDLLNDPDRGHAARAARDTGSFSLAGPFTLRQGGEGIVGRRPIFIEDEGGNRYFWGFSIVVMRLADALMPARLGPVLDDDFDHRLWRIDPDTGRKSVISESTAAALVEPLEREVKLPGAKWVLGVAPAAGWIDYPGLAGKTALGLALSVLLAMVAKLLLDLRAHQSGLEALVERRTAELASREADLNRAQSIANVGSWVSEAGSGRLQWSAHAARMLAPFGASAPEKFSGFLAFVPAGDREALARAFGAALEGESFDIEHRIVVDGEVRWFRHRASADPAPGGTTARVSGTFQEITHRIRAQDALSAAEARFRGLVEQSLAGIYVNQDGKWAYANSRLAQILGYDSPEDLMAVDPLVSVPEDEQERVLEFRRTVLEGDAPHYRYTRRAVRKDGSEITVEVTGTRALHEGRPALLGMIEDVSEKLRRDEQIQRYISQLEVSILSAVEMATMIGEMRDPYTAGHQRRVAAIAVAIGERMGYDANRCEGLRVAGYLHDIGKITIPAAILSKPGKLSAIEYSLVKGHSQASHDVLKSVDFPWPVAEIALQHHERMDGSGYPGGLKGEEILPEARILAVADVMEAMSTHRPYRASLGVDKALAEIERGRGTAYDPKVADACLALFREAGYTIPD